MSTRALTVLLERDRAHPKTPPFNEVVVLYKHYDGYPSGFGLDLANVLASVQLVNGIPLEAEHAPPARRVCNGAGDLWAQLILALKEDQPGDVYLLPAGTRGWGSEYTYVVLAGLEVERPVDAQEPGVHQRVQYPIEAWMIDGYGALGPGLVEGLVHVADGIPRLRVDDFRTAVQNYREEDDG